MTLPLEILISKISKEKTSKKDDRYVELEPNLNGDSWNECIRKADDKYSEESVRGILVKEIG